MIMGLHSRVFAVLVSVFLWFLLGCSLSYASQDDIDCLKSIKDSLEDPLNYLNSSWNFNNNTEGFICRFTGVECWHPDENKVLNIKLSDMELKGVFPRAIKKCYSLTGLDLSSNKLYGSIPSDISKLLPFVTSLDLSSNNFTGSIPVNLSNCSFLNILKLDHNKLTGQIPPELVFLSRLRTFNIASNLLTGPIPNFRLQFSADSFSNNPGVCGKSLDPCQSISKKGAKTGVIAWAAIGGVTVAAIGVGIGLFFCLLKVAVMRKKENKWAKSLKEAKGIKVIPLNLSRPEVCAE